MTPRQALEQQAAHCRRAWKAKAQPLALASLEKRQDPEAETWRQVLAGHHPLALWLDSQEPFDALPLEFPDGSSTRRLLASHPFTGWHPWLNRLTFPESSWTPLDS